MGEKDSPTAVDGRPARRTLWLVTALVAGALTMGLEIAAARLLAPYLGSSLQVWGCLISVILGAMALGYAIGRWLADRSSDEGPMFGAILMSGVCQAGALFLAHPLLRRLAGWTETSAALAAVLLLFALPALLLSGVGPCVIRLSARSRVGTTAGAVYALGTVGSIGGVLLTAFVLLPDLGTRATLQGLAALTLVLGTIGLLPRRAAMLGLVPRPPFRSRPSASGRREPSGPALFVRTQHRMNHVVMAFGEPRSLAEIQGRSTPRRSRLPRSRVRSLATSGLFRPSGKRSSSPTIGPRSSGSPAG